MAAWDAAVSSGQRSTVGDFINEYTKVDKDRDPANKVRRFSDDEFSHQPSTIQTEFEDEYVTDEGEDFNPSSSKQSENSKKATRRALHREHRGAYQFKPVRTAAWVASGFKTTLLLSFWLLSFCHSQFVNHNFGQSHFSHF